MNKENDLQHYLSISPNKIGIYLFDTKSLKNLYKEEITFNRDRDFLNYDLLKKFLDDNVFKIEKLNEKFVDNIILILEDNKIFNLELGIKKKNYNPSITREYLENSLIEAKDLFRENYQDQEIMHMIINKYSFNGKNYSSFKENFKCDNFALEIKFKSISNSIISDLSKILENYQIKIRKNIDGSYLKNIFNNDLELSEMSHKIMTGYNENEVTFVPKKPKKLPFFEKFFQLFS